MRRSNLLTLRKFYKWNSHWFSKHQYQEFILRDTIINNYLISLFRLLKIPTSVFKLKHISLNMLLIECDIYVRWFSKLIKLVNSFFLKYVSLWKAIRTTFEKKIALPLSLHEANINTNKILFFSNSLKQMYSNRNYILQKLVYEYPLLFDNFFYSYIRTSIYLDFLYNSNSFYVFFFLFRITSSFLNQSILHLNSLCLYKNNSFKIENLKVIYSCIKDTLTSSIFEQSYFIKHKFIKVSNFKKKQQLFDNSSLFDKSVAIYSDLKLFLSNTKRMRSKFLIFNSFNGSLLLKSHYLYIYNCKQLKKTFFYRKNARLFFFLKFIFFKLKYKKLQFNYNTYFFILWYINIVWNKITLSILKLYSKNSLINSLNINNFNYNELQLFINHCFFLSKKCFSLLRNKKYLLFKNSYDFRIFSLLFNRCKHFKTISKLFKFYFFTEFFDTLWLTLETTIYNYLDYKFNVLLLPNFFFFYKPYISSAKLICDYIFFSLKRRFRVNKVYRTIKRWQLREKSLFFLKFKKSKNKKFSISYVKQQSLLGIKSKNFTFFALQRMPLKGIRILLSGPPSKARRKSKVFYHLWVANHYITGNMPLQSFEYVIDYYQTYIILKRATIGLKVWLLLESYKVLK